MSNWIIKELEKKAWAEAVSPEIDKFYAKMLERGTRRFVMTGVQEGANYASKRNKRKDGK